MRAARGSFGANAAGENRSMATSRRFTIRQAEAVCIGSAPSAEHDHQRAAATSMEGFAVRIARPGESQYTAVLIPVLEDGRLVLLSRYRYPLASWSLELPRSDWANDDGGWQAPLAASLLRDTGLLAVRFRLLGIVPVDPALLSLETVVVLADGCKGNHPRPADGDEPSAGAVALPPADLDQLVRQGEINCGVSLSALCLYGAWQRRSASLP